MKPLFILLLFLTCLNCKENKALTQEPSSQTASKLAVTYAKGFSIEIHQDYQVLEIKNPWPKSNKTYRYALVNRDRASEIQLEASTFEAVIQTPIQKIVVTSTTHIPALDLLNVEHTLVGFPDPDLVSSEKTRALIEKGMVKNLGKNESINTEILLALRPELVIGFGIDGNNKTFENIQKSGIPVIFNGDWVEKSPLAKAEWIKVFGALYNQEQVAQTVFETIENDYLEAKKSAGEASRRPTVLSGALHRDIWYLPSGTSPEAQLLKDANTHYLWQDTEAEGSLALNFENVFEKAKDAELWINPSIYTSLEALEKANPHYSKFKAFKERQIYSFVDTKGKTGGVTYFEMGMARPDLVLKDLIKIAHPELLPDYDLYFYKRID